ncbi:MAG: hypothetical protein AB4426_24310 [Xenococcaceae cyanobacterium]
MDWCQGRSRHIPVYSSHQRSLPTIAYPMCDRTQSTLNDLASDRPTDYPSAKPGSGDRPFSYRTYATGTSDRTS